MKSNQMRAIRRKRGLTLDELAAKIPTPPNNLKVGKATLSKFELGQRDLTSEWVEVIARALDVCANDLFEIETPAATAERSGR